MGAMSLPDVTPLDLESLEVKTILMRLSRHICFYSGISSTAMSLRDDSQSDFAKPNAVVVANWLLKNFENIPNNQKR